MKQVQLCLLVLLMGAGVMNRLEAQNFRLTPFAGHATGSFDMVSPDAAEMKSGSFYGLCGEYIFDQNYSLLFVYSGQTKEAMVGSYSLKPFQMKMERFELGLRYREAIKSTRFEWFTGFTIGGGIMTDNAQNHTAVRLASSIFGGLNYEVSRKLGFQFQAQLMEILSKTGAIRTSNNTVVQVPGAGALTQAAFTGGLVFSFGK